MDAFTAQTEAHTTNIYLSEERYNVTGTICTNVLIRVSFRSDFQRESFRRSFIFHYVLSDCCWCARDATPYF